MLALPSVNPDWAVAPNQSLPVVDALSPDPPPVVAVVCRLKLTVAVLTGVKYPIQV